MSNSQVFSYVVHKKDAGSPSRTAPQPPVCSNLALHYTANNWLNWRGIGGTTIGHATRRRQTTQETLVKLCLLSRGKLIIATICDCDIAAPVDGCDNCTLHCLWRASARYTITPTYFYLHPNQFWSNAILMIIKSLKIPPENIATWILASGAFSGVDVSHHYSLTRKYQQICTSIYQVS